MKRQTLNGLLTLGCLIALNSQTGCVSAVKHAYYEVRGAKVKVMPAQETVLRGRIIELFAPYQSFTFAPATTTVGPEFCPQRALAAFDAYTANLLADASRGPKLKQHYPGGEPSLHISTEIQFMESKGLLGSALVIARVKFKDSARTVLDAVVFTKSQAFREGGRENLAEETAKGIAEFLITAKTGEKGLDDLLP